MSLAYGGRKDSARERLAAVDDRFAGEALSNTQRSWLAYLHGEVLLDDEPAEALAAFAKAIELADAADSHYVGGVARVSVITLQSRHSPPLAHFRATPMSSSDTWKWVRGRTC